MTALQTTYYLIFHAASKSFVFFKTYQTTFSSIHSHAADLLVTFPCTVDSASAVTTALGGAHS